MSDKCLKIKYESRGAALAAEREMRKNGRVRQRPYRCHHPGCKPKGIWHLSTNPKSGRMKGGRRGLQQAGDRTGDPYYRTSPKNSSLRGDA